MFTYYFVLHTTVCRGVLEGKEDYNRLAPYLKRINDLLKVGQLPDGTRVMALGGGKCSGQGERDILTEQIVMQGT